MMRRELSLLPALVLVLACSETPASRGQASGSIVNGDPLDDAASQASQAVSIRRRVGKNIRLPREDGGFTLRFEPVGTPIGSGTLINQSAVLTAAHVLNNEEVGDVRIFQGNAAVVRTANVLEFRRYPDFDVNGDLAILLLDRAFSGVAFAGLDCAEQPAALVGVKCVSGTIHDILPPPQNRINPRAGVINEATFLIDFNFISPRIFTYDANDFIFPANLVFDDQAPFNRDSGMGCFHPGIGVLTGVHSKIAAPDFLTNPTRIDNITGDATKVRPFCKWITTLGQPEGKAAFLIDVDGDKQPDVVAVNQVGEDTFGLSIDRTRLGDLFFSVTIPGASAILGATIGNFTGGGPALALTSDGGLRTAAFNDGPQPNIAGAPSSDYTMMATARLNGDSLDDLVARREDGVVDGFLGSSTGLQFNPDITPIAMNLDGDFVPDFVWLQDDNLNVFSTQGGRSFLTLSDPITLDIGKPGRFRRVSTDYSIQDLVVLGEGTLIWCDSTLFGLKCNSALDAPFYAAGRIATDFDVRDVNLDALDDLIVSYSNAPDRTFLAKPGGFTPLAPARSFRQVLPADINADGQAESIAVDDEGGDLLISVIDEAGNEIGPVNFGAFDEPTTLAAANLNDDGLADALAPGFLPLDDLVIRSGDELFALVSNGDGTFELLDFDNPGDIVDVAVVDSTGDGIDDVEVTLTDGSVTTFAGGATPDTVGRNFTGLPTADGEDGKMLLLSGLGVDTVGATESRFRISVGPGDVDALDQLTVQIFDGDNGGLHQFEEQTNVLKTCYRLSADPCGDSNAGSCMGGPTDPVELTTVSSDTLGDDRWDTIFDGAHSPAASIFADGEAPFNYELRVFLSEDCSVLPTVGATIGVATADAFKVRSNGLLSMPVGEFSLVGSDSDGDFGVAGLPYLRDTDYDGRFELAVAVGSSATEIQLKESDADDTTDSTPGVAFGANAEIQYRLLDPNGDPAGLAGEEDATATTLVTNPSGNNDGILSLDVETRIHGIGAPTPGTWIWQWEGVRAANAFHVFTPFGSPTTHEVLGARRARPTLSSAEQPYFWEDRSLLEAALPVLLGHRLPDQSLEGTSEEIVSAERALEVLGNAHGTLDGELLRQLFVAKLNGVRGSALGENLEGGLVYGTTRTVRGTLRAADDIAAGVDPWADQPRRERLVQLLSSVNLGELTYQQPGVPFPERPMADLDADGVVDLKDNCPSVPNPLQEDEDDNRIGNACNVRPSVACVLGRSPDTLTAYFDYDNPLSLRTIAPGWRNDVTSSTGSRGFDHPTEFADGLRRRAFHADFARSEALSWTLEGETVVADAASAECSGSELALVDFVPRAALYGAESVVVGDHVLLRAPQDLAGIVSGGEVVIGGDSSVGDVFAASSALLCAGSVIRGSLVAGGILEKQAGARVLGTTRTLGVLRSHSIAWWVDLAGAGADSVLAPNEARTLSPGTYGETSVPSGATLILAPGRYRFGSLDVARGGTLLMSSGETVLHVRDALSHRGETRHPGESAKVVLGYLGTQPVTLDASFRGVVVAPKAALVLGAVRNSTYSGAFVARAIEVRPGSIVEFAKP